uniref:Uncharacterized protein n=1 Tax=Rhizophora mucronata TaxID=61149 RepID=A0A2P2N8I9_RHIMU
MYSTFVKYISNCCLLQKVKRFVFTEVFNLGFYAMNRMKI